jgi:predicted Zn-dependent protease
MMGQMREKESDADRRAVRLLVDAGVDPKALLSMLEKLAAEEARLPEHVASDPSSKLFEKMRTHPQLAQRMADVEEEIARAPLASPQPFDLDYQTLATSAKAGAAGARPALPPGFTLPEAI